MHCKILLYNLNYCTGLTGPKSDYLFKSFRYLHTPKEIQEDVLGEVNSLIGHEMPDICCFIEIFEEQIKKLTDKRFNLYDVSNKYGSSSSLSWMPFFKSRSNGVLSRQDVSFKKHYFKFGRKRLIYEIFYNGLSVFLVHLSLKSSVRSKQFKELFDLVKWRDKVVICGDFNVFNGFEEFDSLLEGSRLKVVNSPEDKTYPAFKPSKSMDVFICSKDVKILGFKIADLTVSDHLPVLLEVSY